MRAYAWLYSLLFLLTASVAEAGSVEIVSQAGGTFSVKVLSFKELRLRAVVLQQYDFSCGSAALATLLTFHYQDPTTEEMAFRSMFEQGDQQKIQQEGFSLFDMKLFLESKGYQADGFEVSLDDLKKAGIPAIVLITDNGYNHFVVIKGIRDNQVLIGDPAIGARVISRAVFENLWRSRVVFVIRTKQDRASFNSVADWSLRPRAPLGNAVNRDSLASVTVLLRGKNDF